MPVVLTASAAADARISARTMALVESRQLLADETAAIAATSPTASAVEDWSATPDRRYAKGHRSRVRPFPPRASALRAYDDRQSSRGQGAEAQMAATAVEAWDERWTTPKGRADWLVWTGPFAMIGW